MSNDELVYATMNDVQKLTESYIEQNEATVKKIFDKLRELEHRLSYLEVGRN
jgi:hypothetical protein